MWFKAHLRVSPSVKQEGGLSHQIVDVVIVQELCKGKQRIPVILLLFDKESQVLL